MMEKRSWQADALSLEFASLCWFAVGSIASSLSMSFSQGVSLPTSASRRDLRRRSQVA